MSTPATTNGSKRIFSTVRGVPFPTLESLKAMLGIAETDTSKDANIMALLQSSLAMIEAFCGRIFMLDDYEEHFLPIDARNPYLRLSAFPVEVVRSVYRDIGLEGVPFIYQFRGWKLFPQQGLLRQFTHGCCWCCGLEWEGADTIVDYRGGYPADAWPVDLVDILLALFMDRWNATGGTGNIADSTGGGGSGEIKSATVDGMRLDYDVGGGGGLAKGAGDIPPPLWPYYAALARYRDVDLWGI